MELEEERISSRNMSKKYSEKNLKEYAVSQGLKPFTTQLNFQNIVIENTRGERKKKISRTPR